VPYAEENKVRIEAALTAAMVDKFGAERKNWPNCKQGPAQVIKNFAEFNAK
jgi:hypothetical protein